MVQTCIHAAAANARGIGLSAAEQEPERTSAAAWTRLPDRATPTRVEEPNNLPAEDTE